MNQVKTNLKGTMLLFSVLGIFVINISCEQYDDPVEDDWDEEELDERAKAQRSGCEGKCSASCQCAWTEIGCSADRDCQSGLYCKKRPKLGNRCLKKSSSDDSNDNNNDNNNSGGDCHEFKPGHGKYCSSSCKCSEGQGDCDKDSECKAGLKCKQQSGTDFCVRAGGGADDDDDDNGGGGGDSGGAKSNLQVRLGGTWKGVCCVGGDLKLSGSSCKWTESGRVMRTKDVRTGNRTALNCPENNQRPKDCNCTSSGERMHGIKANGSVSVSNSLRKSNGAPIYPNSKHETCVDLVGGSLQSRWTSSSCPNWRLVNFY